MRPLFVQCLIPPQQKLIDPHVLKKLKGYNLQHLESSKLKEKRCASSFGAAFEGLVALGENQIGQDTPTAEPAHSLADEPHLRQHLVACWARPELPPP